MTFSIGVDVGGTKILAGLVDDSGNVVSTARRPTPRNDATEVLNVVSEVVRELGAPHDDPHKAQIDGGLQHGRKIRQHVFVDRVELEDADLVFGQQLVQNVQWRNRRHIAGAQHQGDFSFAVGLGRVVSLCCVAGEVVGADPGLHPNLGANAA